MISLLKIDTGRSSAEPALIQRANEHSHVLRGEREEGGRREDGRKRRGREEGRMGERGESGWMGVSEMNEDGYIERGRRGGERDWGQGEEGGKEGKGWKMKQ